MKICPFRPSLGLTAEEKELVEKGNAFRSETLRLRHFCNSRDFLPWSNREYMTNAMRFDSVLEKEQPNASMINKSRNLNLLLYCKK